MHSSIRNHVRTAFVCAEPCLPVNYAVAFAHAEPRRSLTRNRAFALALPAEPHPVPRQQADAHPAREPGRERAHHDDRVLLARLVQRDGDERHAPLRPEVCPPTRPRCPTPGASLPHPRGVPGRASPVDPRFVIVGSRSARWFVSMMTVTLQSPCLTPLNVA